MFGNNTRLPETTGRLKNAAETGRGDAAAAFPAEMRLEIRKLFTDCFDPLVAFLRLRFGAGPPDPEDVAQQAFGKLMERERLSDIENPKAFLWRTARNIAVSEKRSLTRAGRREADAAAVFSIEEGYLLTPERVLEAKEQVGVALNVLRKMPGQRRRAFILTRIEGLSHGEAAKRLGVSRPAVSKHVAKATVDLYAALMAK